MRFSVGDCVRVLGSVVEEVCGEIGEVISIDHTPMAYPYLVRFEGYPNGLCFDEMELEQAAVEVSCTDIVDGEARLAVKGGE